MKKISLHALQIFWVLSLLAGFVVMGLGVRHLVGVPDLLTPKGILELRQRFLSLGGWMPLGFCLFYALRGIIYIPEPILMMTSGFLFGPLWGTVLSVIGSSLAASVGYSVSRMLVHWGRVSFISHLFKRKWQWVESLQSRWGWRAMFVWRMMPVFPFTMFTYGSAWLRVPFKKFILIMILGVIPPALFYAYIGSAVINPDVWSKFFEFTRR